MSQPPRNSSRPSVSRRLNDEWARLAANRRTTAHIDSWGRPLAPYGDADGVLAAIGRDGGLPMAAADELFAALVRLGRDDVLAARIALQRVLPGLVNAAARRSASRPGDRQVFFDDLVANAWVVIRTFPLERRPAKIAVNVLRDAEYLTFVRPVRLRSSGEHPTPIRPESSLLAPCRLDGTPEDHPAVVSQIADLLKLGASSGLCQRDIEMLGALTLGGWTADALAERYAVTCRTVRNRRARTTRALAALAAA